jgi:uncharacterized repeat protein (TIGR03803 family)
VKHLKFGIPLTWFGPKATQRKLSGVFTGLCALAIAAVCAAPARAQMSENEGQSPSLTIQRLPATYSVLYSFNGYPNDGAQPWEIGGTLVRDASGNLYGSTSAGGNAVCQGVPYQPGTVVELSGNTETVLFNFSDQHCGGDVGISPTGALALDSAGNLYGTTQEGGSSDCGNVWKLSGSSFTVLYDFGCSEGGYPYAGVILDRQGNIYGTTALGGTYGNGIVYEINSQGGFGVLYAFTGGADGGKPYGGVAMDLAGNLYGMTYVGGTSQDGVVYELSRSGGGWTETVLHSFSGSPNDGANPRFASLTLQSTGPLTQIYGVTELGGSNGNGTAFKMARGRSGYNFTLLHSFTRANGDGGLPRGTLLGLNGKLYGTTAAGGDSNDWGTVFELSPPLTPFGSWQETILYNFTGSADGGTPIAGLVADSTGALYGAARDGGIVNNSCSSGCGVIFKVQPLTGFLGRRSLPSCSFRHFGSSRL